MTVISIKKFIYINSKTKKFIFCLLLSWLYALCSQIVIPLPFNLVPISLQPAPLFLCSLLLGWPAVWAYFMCIFQTALGAPFFSDFQGGLAKLLGPTGGYIFGFALAMIFLVIIKDYKKNNFYINFAKLIIANVIFFLVGLFQLQFFICDMTIEKLLAMGLIPFIVGDLLKTIFVSILGTKSSKNPARRY